MEKVRGRSTTQGGRIGEQGRHEQDPSPQAWHERFQRAWEEKGFVGIAEEFGPELLRKLREHGDPLGDDEVRASIHAESAEVEEEYPDFPEGKNPFEGTSIRRDSVEALTAAALENMRGEMRQTIEECGAALTEGDTDRASTLVRELATRMEAAGKDALPPEMHEMYDDVRTNLEQAIKEKDPQAKSRLYKFACGAMDFIPVAGPAKMIVEAAAGKTLGGNTLEGWQRFLHLSEGLVFTMVDLTGFGAVATKLTKAGKAGVHLGPRLLTRTAALMRKLGVARKIYSPIFKSGRFLFRHPQLARAASRGVREMFDARTGADVWRLAQTLKPEDWEHTEEPMAPDMVADVAKRPGMNLEGEDSEGDEEESFLSAA